MIIEENKKMLGENITNKKKSLKRKRDLRRSKAETVVHKKKKLYELTE